MGEFQIRLYKEGGESISKARLCKNGKLNSNAEKNSEKVVAFPAFNAGSCAACAA